MDENQLLQLLTRQRSAPVYVCRLRDDAAQAIGAHSRTVLLSSETTRKQEIKRGSPGHDLYMRAPFLIENGHILIDGPYHAVFIFHERTDKIRSYKAVVKATRDGHELFLVSVHRIGKTEVRATYRRAIRLTEWKKGRREVGPPKNPTLRSRE